MIQRLKFCKIAWLFLCQFLFLRERPREFRENNKQIIRTTDKCRNPDSPNLICSGHGTCECDKCKCNEDDDGQYTGIPRIIQFLRVGCLITWLIFQSKMTTFSVKLVVSLFRFDKRSHGSHFFSASHNTVFKITLLVYICPSRLQLTVGSRDLSFNQKWQLFHTGPF